MDKKKLTRLIAVCTACLSMGIFAFSGCAKKGKDDGSKGDNTEISGSQDKEDVETPGGSKDKEDVETPGGSKDKEDVEEPGGSKDKEDVETPGTGTDPTMPGDPIVKPSKPEITGPVAGGPTITKYSEAELEAAYVEWTAAENAKWYNVYYSPKGANNWTKLDAPLVREYKDYFRADAPGLKAGEYDMKVVPVSGEDTEAEQYAAEAAGITVVAHDRSGYAFTGENIPGAYKADGTLKEGAQVVYVTAANAKTVTADVGGTQVAGLQSILDARQGNSITQTPLCIRIVGTVSLNNLDNITSKEEGIQIKGTDKNPAANITIEGVGNDGTVNGFGFLIRNSSYLEISNLGIINFIDDGVSVDTKNNYLWMHNLDIFYGGAGSDKDQAKGDGSLDIKKSYYCTVSYNHFWDSGKCCLLDAQEGSGDKASNYVTYHHNWFDHSDSRHARIRNASAVHVYNNYYDGNSKYGVGGVLGSSTLVENNYFRSTSSSTKPIMIAGQGTDAKGEGTFSSEAGGMIKAIGNVFNVPSKPISHKTSATDFDYYEATSRNEQVPSSIKTKLGGSTYSNFDTASDFYEYKVDTAEVAKEKVEMYAGRMQGGDLKWTFDNETEDGNYSIISELKSKVVGYNGSVVSIGGVAVTGGTTPGGTTGGNTGTGDGDGDEEATTNPVEGAISFVPTASGNGFTVAGTNKSNPEMTVGGVKIPKNGALKLTDSGSVTFTTTEEMILTIYVERQDRGAKIDNVLKAGKDLSSEGSYYFVSVTISAGTHTITKGGGENTLYLIKLTPKA